MAPYLIYASNTHPTFRIPELLSLAKFNARRLIARSLSIKGIYALLATGKDHAALHDALKQHIEYPFPAYCNVSFKFIVDSFERKRSIADQQAVINDFAHLNWQGKIDMKAPDEVFYVFEHWFDTFVLDVEATLQRVFFTRAVKNASTARSRGLISQYDLKKREYLGTTSMDAELSLLTANQILATDGGLVYDPFVGTGSFLIAASAFGATCIGSDIDGRQKDSDLQINIQTNYDQYDFPHLLLDCLVFDIKHPPWHTNLQVDGIATDCPYAIRAGAKTLGRDLSKPKTQKHYADQDRSLPSRVPQTQGGGFVHQRQDYLPPKKPYELDEMMADLLNTSFTLLKPGARLAVWLPILPEEDTLPNKLPPSLLNHTGMHLVSDSVQIFSRWSRRLLTFEKVIGQESIDLDSPQHSVASA
ncbi:hypothetical protein BCR37DRAFT_370759 [Protomyces lactucae-debilis]|uniref:Uncharacterized protein n=1 Tax=Protomyces lactucae-debilis TaxID=2754530 RepID=A0A1Y2F3Z3_PROLT|nr:uncharacterized protein BCR37DRAFT_370759 [Protomyces lactucae-debilis]ORY78204.1 hypothetical protein BCR37DRAFT_370759 [Protomyces lactucae-debilis]